MPSGWKSLPERCDLLRYVLVQADKVVSDHSQDELFEVPVGGISLQPLNLHSIDCVVKQPMAEL